MSDPTETIRRELVAEQNANLKEREALEKEHGDVYDTDQLREQFSVVGFMAPFVVVRRKKDGVTGSMMFQHMPRFYYGFKPD